MKKLLLLLTMNVYTIGAFAQTDTTYLKLVHNEIRKVQRARTIHYAPSASVYLSAYCNDYLKNEMVSLDKTDTLKLTSSELKYIKHEIETSKNSTWPDQLFPDSKVAGDTIHTTLSKLNRAIFDSVKNLDNKELAGKAYGLRFYYRYWFSKPIYLRNKSILIFYFIWYHNSSGENTLNIYRKEGDSYKPWMYGCGGAW